MRDQKSDPSPDTSATRALSDGGADATAKRRRRAHPGRGEHRTRRGPRGRQVDPAAMREVERLIGDEVPERSRLIEYLHLIQDRHRQLAKRHLVALAARLRLPMSEVFEVASFYAHFDVVEDEQVPPDVTVRVCQSLSCALAGASDLANAIEHGLRERDAEVRVVPAPCMGRCDLAPAVEVGHRHLDRATLEGVIHAVDAGDVHPEIPKYQGLSAYRASGGYASLSALRAGTLSVEDIIDTLDASGLRGLGGAGFPTGRKWSIVRSYPGPRLMAVNADEGEPGTFKDRVYLENHPHQFLEGMLIAAEAVQAEKVYIYLRDEYPAAREILDQELRTLSASGLDGSIDIELRRGAGAYICGEESAMLESIEGKRGLPRHRPPYVAERGLFDRPTLVQNVETLYWVPEIVRRGAPWFADAGRRGAKGWRSYSVSGRVRSPGVKLAPAGTTVRELIDEYCDGMAEGETFKAYLPGGASGGILPASMGDIALDFGQLEAHGCFVGSHAVVVLSERDDMTEVALNLMRFFHDESCGQCTPCRVGTEKAVGIMAQAHWDRGLLAELGQVMADASICGLGQAAANPVLRVLEHFPVEVTQRSDRGRHEGTSD